jgi:hypothetical protein
MTDSFKTVIAAAHLNWEDPEEINMKWFGQDKRTLHEILDGLYPDCDIDALTFLYQHYDFLENQIHQFLDMDGMAYDKSNWILKQYFEELVGGMPDQLGEDRIDPLIVTRECDKPEFGTTDEWLDFVKAMCDLYRNGPKEKNMAAILRMRRLRQTFMDNRKD